MPTEIWLAFVLHLPSCETGRMRIGVVAFGEGAWQEYEMNLGQ